MIHIPPTLLLLSVFATTALGATSAQPSGFAFMAASVPCGNAQKDCSVRRLLFRNNTVVDWRGGVQLVGAPGTELQNIRVERNELQNPLDGSTPLLSHDAIDPLVFSYTGNAYDRGGDGYWFEVDGGGPIDTDFEGWVALSGETDAISGPLPYVDPTRDLAAYDAFAGGAGTVESFLAEARLQSRSSWRAAYTATAANRWIRAGYRTP